MMSIRRSDATLKIVSLLAVAAIGGCATATSKPQKADAMEQPSEPPTEIVMKKQVLDTRTLFDFDSARLRPEGRAKLDKLINEAGGEAADDVTVTGHTDRIGPSQYNMGLSERRANAVADYMRQNGVPASAIRVYSKGETQPLVQCEDQNWNALVECLQPNRRVVVQYPVMVEKEVVRDN